RRSGLAADGGAALPCPLLAATTATAKPENAAKWAAAQVGIGVLSDAVEGRQQGGTTSGTREIIAIHPADGAEGEPADGDRNRGKNGRWRHQSGNAGFP